jgi:hypothetical protein
MDLSVVLTSAAVSAMVSTMSLLILQWLDRRARRREFLMKTATDWAAKHMEFEIDLAKASGRARVTPSLGMLADGYYRELSYLMKHGKPLPEVLNDYEGTLKALGLSRPKEP